MIGLSFLGSVIDAIDARVFVSHADTDDISIRIEYGLSNALRVKRKRTFWRLTGRDSNRLLAIELSGGLLTGIELTLYDQEQITEFPFIPFSKVVTGVPVLELEAVDSICQSKLFGSCIDNAIDFKVSVQKDRIRFSWEDRAPARVVSFKDIIFYELSADAALVGLTVHTNSPDVLSSQISSGER